MDRSFYPPYYDEGILRYFGQNVSLSYIGWEATLIGLLRQGWKFHLNASPHNMRASLFMCHRDMELVAHFDEVDLMQRRHQHRLCVSQMSHIRGTHITAHEQPMYREMELRMSPYQEAYHYRDRHFCLMDILQPVDVEKLLVAREDEKTVDDLLKHILSKQANLREEIAIRRVKENLIEKPSAQIVKLFAA